MDIVYIFLIIIYPFDPTCSSCSYTKNPCYSLYHSTYFLTYSHGWATAPLSVIAPPSNVNNLVILLQKFYCMIYCNQIRYL
jgi:hypothetical protein